MFSLYRYRTESIVGSVIVTTTCTYLPVISGASSSKKDASFVSDPDESPHLSFARSCPAMVAAKISYHRLVEIPMSAQVVPPGRIPPHVWFEATKAVRK